MTQPLKIAVMGAGAVGCYFGGMLARAGHEVVLIARPEHVAAVAQDGLRMETKTFDEHVRWPPSSDASAVRGANLVLFCVKSIDTESAGAQILPHLAPDALVLTLQNGVDNADRLRAVLPEHEVAAAVVYVATEMAGPGHVKHHGRGELVIEPSSASEGGGPGADRRRRADRDLRQRAWRAVGQADPQLRLQRACRPLPSCRTARRCG